MKEKLFDIHIAIQKDWLNEFHRKLCYDIGYLNKELCLDHSFFSNYSFSKNEQLESWGRNLAKRFRNLLEIKNF